MKPLITLLSFLTLISLIPLQNAVASSSETFETQTRIGDGKQGRLWAQWKQTIKEAKVQRVIARVEKLKGGSDVFLNLRFGDSTAFEGGEQKFLPNSEITQVQWQVNENPNARPLVLNAYKGEVLVHSVQVFYSVDSTTASDQSPADTPASDSTTTTDVSSTSASQQSIPQCQEGNYQAPKIRINEVKSSGGMFSGDYRILGTVQGNCIEEAGYYEKGRLKEEFTVPYSARFQRNEFNLKVRSGQNGELRAYTTTGSETTVEIDSAITDYRSNNKGGGLGGLGDLLP